MVLEKRVGPGGEAGPLGELAGVGAGCGVRVGVSALAGAGAGAGAQFWTDGGGGGRVSVRSMTGSELTRDSAGRPGDEAGGVGEEEEADSILSV